MSSLECIKLLITILKLMIQNVLAFIISFILPFAFAHCCINFRMLVYEYVNNGNLEQWLHGGMRQHGYLTWEARMKILLGTAKA
jgi:hypothetical protein